MAFDIKFNRAIFLNKFILWVLILNLFSGCGHKQGLNADEIISKVKFSLDTLRQGNFTINRIRRLSGDSVYNYNGYFEFIKKSSNDSVANFILFYNDSLEFFYDSQHAYKINNNAKVVQKYSLKNKSFYNAFKNHYEGNFLFMPYLSMQENKFRFFMAKPFINIDKFKTKTVKFVSDTLLVQCFDTLLYDNIKYINSLTFKINPKTYLINEFADEITANPYFYRDRVKISELKWNINRLSEFNLMSSKQGYTWEFIDE
jgi:hypothetical protein